MWAHRRWLGTFLPATSVGRELEAYSRVVNAVEGNTTFYATPPPATVRKWAVQVHPDFRFVFKVPKRITHELRLRDIDADLTAFVDAIEPLHANVGALTLQLPASFAPIDLGVLDGVLKTLPSGWRWSVEVRHRAFFEGPAQSALDRMLARHGTERVLLDSRSLFARPPLSENGRDAWQKKPRVPTLTDAVTDQPIVRFIGSDHADLTADGLQQWQPIITDWLHDGRTPSLFVHTPDNATSPGLARAFHAEIARSVPDLGPLPEPLPVEAAVQESLF